MKTIVDFKGLKKHEKFLTKTFPKILEEEVTRRMKILLEGKGGVNPSSTQIVEDEVDFESRNKLYNKKEKNLKNNSQEYCFK